MGDETVNDSQSLSTADNERCRGLPARTHCVEDGNVGAISHEVFDFVLKPRHVAKETDQACRILGSP